LHTLGIDTTNSKYYHFQYSSATNLLIVAKTTISGSPATFNIEIPGTATVYEQAWSHKGFANDFYDSASKIDQTKIDDIVSYGYGNHVGYGILSLLPQTNLLAPDIFHVVYVDGISSSNYCGICLVILYA
jgi:hypothetical protein